MVDVTDIEKLYLIKLGFGDKDSTLNTEIVFKDPAKRDTEFEKLVPKLTKPLIEGDHVGPGIPEVNYNSDIFF